MAKPTKWHVLPAYLDQAWYLPNIHSPHQESFGPYLSNEHTTETDQRVYRNDPKFSDRKVWSNSADPDQTAPRGAV